MFSQRGRALHREDAGEVTPHASVFVLFSGLATEKHPEAPTASCMKGRVTEVNSTEADWME